ncbi:MAG TPA: ParA family protein, partial [Herpetosiphonaceae bacterium]
MPRVIAIANFKGGIGKTTTTINVAAGFALKGAKVLVVDVDAQNNVQMAFGMPSPRRSLYNVLVENAKVADCVAPARPNLDVLVAGDSLLMGQTELSRRNDWGRVLEMALKPASRDYDFVFIDCSASVTVLNWNALMAATDIVVPTALEHLAMQGLSQISRSITRVKGSLTAMRAIVPTMYDTRNRLSNELLASLRSAHGQLVTEPIRVNVRLAEAPAHGKTIYEYDPRSRGAADYAALVEHLGTLFNYRPAPPAPAPEPAAAPAAPLNGF